MAARRDAETAIPVIDISRHDPQVADDLVAAVIKWGFVYVRGDVGFTKPEVDGMFDLVRLFYWYKDLEEF